MAVLKGTVLFSSTAKPDLKFGAPGNYYVTLSVDEATYADAEQLGLKCKRNVYRGEEQLTVNLKLKGGGKRKDGSDYINDAIKVVVKTEANNKAPYIEKGRDENGEIVERQKEIPRGSRVKVSYKARTWEMMGKTGTAFDLRAVQIIEEGSNGDPMDEFEDDDDDEDF
ncbi:hypothetical protein CHOED_064 [Vibrio phage CHOED]|uniref:hypothetical protein n=1 Tax=Vibrio phage CHOED TaxID=1458716 RepID=UPI00042E6996|nr:hypothetical protein CHOED_064 [Vibrio phage CHOED]AHK11924.1 hypothetical protein CHOED_064 [Vibrio phage CHOED]